MLGGDSRISDHFELSDGFSGLARRGFSWAGRVRPPFLSSGKRRTGCTTVTLSIGTVKMARKKVIVKHLAAIQKLCMQRQHRDFYRPRSRSVPEHECSYPEGFSNGTSGSPHNEMEEPCGGFCITPNI
jgi:hypothetical protein